MLHWCRSHNCGGFYWISFQFFFLLKMCRILLKIYCFFYEIYYFLIILFPQLSVASYISQGIQRTFFSLNNFSKSVKIWCFVILKDFFFLGKWNWSRTFEQVLLSMLLYHSRHSTKVSHQPVKEIWARVLFLSHPRQPNSELRSLIPASSIAEMRTRIRIVSLFRHQRGI